MGREKAWGFDRLHFCGAKAPLFLHFMRKTKENAIGAELAEYPARLPQHRLHFAALRATSLFSIWQKKIRSARSRLRLRSILPAFRSKGDSGGTLRTGGTNAACKRRIFYVNCAKTKRNSPAQSKRECRNIPLRQSCRTSEQADDGKTPFWAALCAPAGDKLATDKLPERRL